MACQLGPFAFKPSATRRLGPAKVVIRPERVLLGPTDGETPAGASTFPGLVDHVIYLGPTTHVVVRLSDGQTLLAAVPNSIGPASVWYQPGRPGAGPRAPGGLPPAAADTRPALAADAEDTARRSTPDLAAGSACPRDAALRRCPHVIEATARQI